MAVWKQEKDRPHPQKKPQFPGELTLENCKTVFADCADFATRSAFLHNDTKRQVDICYLNGVVMGERINDYILRPLAQDPFLASVGMHEAYDLLKGGALYNLYVKERTTLDDVAADLVTGYCALFFPEHNRALTFFVSSEEKRSVGEPDNEPVLKGARDSFVESVLTNSATVRRRLRVANLKIRQHVIGRHSQTPIFVLWLDGIAPEETVKLAEDRLQQMDIDGMEGAGSLEEYLTDRVDTPFPLMMYTQRPDRFCGALLEGRVGILAEGLAIGYILPGTIEQFFRTAQDKSFNWMTATMLMTLRYFCLTVTLLLPALYIALVTFHPEAIPVKLALSIVSAKQEVPFSSVFEVLIMLVAFEVLQEAGLRLPGPIGATVSILGGLVVGNAAVEARIVSPAVLIAVAIAGIAGYTIPSQDFSNAVRLWRFLLAVLASVGGLFGVICGVAALVRHLAGLESFGTPYLAPFSVGAGQGIGKPDVLRPPLPKFKWRAGIQGLKNRRNQQ